MKLYLTQIDAPDSSLTAAFAAKGWQLCHFPFRRVVLHEEVGLPQEDYDVWIITSKQAARWLQKQPRPAKPPPLAVVGNTTTALLQAWPRLFDPAPANAAELALALRKRFSQPANKSCR